MLAGRHPRSLSLGGYAPRSGRRRSLLSHERIREVPRRDERLLDRPRADPANEIQHRTGFVVGSGPARPAKRLLPDDGPGRFVVDIEVSGGIPECAHRFPYRDAVAAEHRTGQRIWRSAIDDIE